MIGFTAPWVLLGLLAAGIPVLLHLFARREPPTVMFPATRYLAETARAHHRRLTLQHWLLLLVRTLLIAALVLAAAGPTLPGGPAATHAPSAVTLVLDNSLSSATTVAGTPVVERLKRAALAILDAARAGDALWLLTADGSPRRGSAAELSAIVKRTTALPARLDLGAAIGIAREAMAAERLPASVVVVSDLQASALAQASGSGTVVALRPEESPVTNLGLAALLTGRQPWGPEGGSVAVRASGTAGKRAAVSLRIGTRPPRRQLASGNEEILLGSGALTSGWWPVRAELEPDELRLDDVRETAIRVADASRAAWRSEDRFLATAAEVLLSNGRLIRGGDLSLGNLGQGASIVQPPADPAGHGALNRALAARGAGWRFGELVPGSTVTDSGPVLGRHPVSRRYGLVPAGSAATGAASPRGVLATAGGLPWVVRSDNLILLGSRLEPEWTALPLSAEFVPFVDFLANRAIRGELAILDTQPGDPIALPDAATAVVRDGQVRPVEGGGPFRSRETGLHFILAGRDTIGAVAVNPDPRESALERSGDSEIRRLWPGARIAPLERAASAAFAAGGLADLRGFFLVLAAALALADAALAGLGARRGARAA
ncbi:MAG TPA: BatA domain-containing protein [Gemmatimonadales bacterium]|nr:BatA domain-containing protein [Gemmatimonadales bacterium]